MSDSPWTPAPTRGKGGSSAPTSVGRIIEIVTVLILGLATVGSAWSAYQVSQWNGIETDEARVAASHRIDASREYALATQIVAYDAAAVSQFAQAVALDNVPLQEFMKSALIRPAFLPKLEEWQRQIAAGETPTNLLDDEVYKADLFAASSAEDDAAAAASIRSEAAGSNAEDYVLLTLFFATALFFAGVTASFSTRFTKVILITAAAAVLLFAGAQLISYPVA